MAIPAAIFKAECLKLMDEVARSGRPLVITKHGRPVAQLAPVPAQPQSLFGYMKGHLTIHGDVVTPVAEAWSAEQASDDLLPGRAAGKPRGKRTVRKR